MKTAIVIPARLNSTRLPFKVIADIGGKPMIWWVYQKAISVQNAQRVIIAVDDEQVKKVCEDFGAETVMTSIDHQSGTDRIGEVAMNFLADFDYVINIQGDEPLIDSKNISDFIKFMISKRLEIGTISEKISSESDLFDFNVVKVIHDINQKAIYFSRNAIPAFRDFPYKEWLSKYAYQRHTGIYGFKISTLLDLVKLPQSNLELIEKLEQLRWLENGYSIGLQTIQYASKGVDTEEDLQNARRILE
jgi:3-deoxy-manno-octulosonate cytidylyltransferase (CMP-KDO synthetase)